MARRKKRRLKIWISFILCALIVIVSLSGYFFYRYSLSAVSANDEPVVITVEEGEVLSEVLADLQDQNLIRSASLTGIYARIHGMDIPYAGSFALRQDMSAVQILDYLNDSANIISKYEIVTIPEGYWAKQIAEVLSKHFSQYTQQQFLDLWNDENYIQTLSETYTFLNPDEISDEVFVKLEGYLFPETYYFDKDFSPQQITEMFLDGFDAVYQELYPQIQRSELDLEEILTLASIVQFEAGNPKDMKDIAGVFYNRLAAGMKLQSSVTVCYALYDEFKNFEDCEINYDIDSPYNSYLVDGLPIGPILNPGYDAIEAVLNPSDNDYLFFVSDIYGDGTVYYAKTYEEHLANMEKYNLNIE